MSSIFAQLEYRELMQYPKTPLPLIQRNDFQEMNSIKTDAFDFLQTVKKTEEATYLVLVRHGQSLSNLSKGIAGRTDDSELTTPQDLLGTSAKSGIEQSQECGQKFLSKAISFDAVYSSPMKRVEKTISLILTESENSSIIQTDDLLLEKFYGVFEGATEKQYRPVKEAEEKYNTGPELSFDQKFKFIPDELIDGLPADREKMESMHEVYERGIAFAQKVRQKHPGKIVLAGTHNAPIKAFFMVDVVRKSNKDLEYRQFDVSNCAVIVLKITNNDIEVVATNGVKYKK